MKISILLLSAVLSVSAYPPMFKQCDLAWGSNPLGVSGGRTVCQSGCLVSSVAMLLNQCGISLPVTSNTTASANPGSLNTWLKANNGFEDGYGFKWASVAPLGLTFERFSQDPADLMASLAAGKRLFLHVRNLNHYVLANGYQPESKPGMGDAAFYVNDPNHDVQFYPQSEVVKGQTAIFDLDRSKCKY